MFNHYRCLRYKVCLTFLLSFLGCVVLWGDYWYPPKKETYFSEDQSFRVDVIPTREVSGLAFWQAQLARKEGARAQKMERPASIAVVYRRNSRGAYTRVSTFALRNEVAPVEAFISNDGRFVVTADEWYGTGYGENVLVIYRQDGTLVKHFPITDLMTQSDIEKMERSTSSIRWLKSLTFSDSQSKLLLHMGDCRLCETPCACKMNLTIHLETGELGRALETHIPVSEGVLSISRDAIPQAKHYRSKSARPTEPTVSKDLYYFMDSPDFLSHLVEQTLPEFPEKFRKFRLKKTSTFLEVFVSPAGEVQSIAILKAVHPNFGSARALLDHVRSWRFKPFEKGGQAIPFRGRIKVDYALPKHCPAENR